MRKGQTARAPGSAEVRRVLVVDDRPNVRRAFAGVISRSGMHVEEADNGRKALDLALERTPDAIVSDIQMPEMDGLELCRHLRANPLTRHVVVVIVSGDLSRHEAVEAGCDAILEKPCPPTLLVQTLKQLLKA
jgi:two-component system response regulator ResD